MRIGRPTWRSSSSARGPCNCSHSSRAARASRNIVLEPSQPSDPRQFLHLIRGEYEHDAIGVEYEAVGGHAWVFRDGRWQSVVR